MIDLDISADHERAKEETALEQIAPRFFPFTYLSGLIQGKAPQYERNNN